MLGIIMATGSGPPTHQAPEGTIYWDYTGKYVYINEDGATTWSKWAKVGGESTSDMHHVFAPNTPNEVVRPWGDGNGTARGLTFSGVREAKRLRVAFKADAPGSQLQIRVRLYKWDSGTTSSILLASVSLSAGTSDQYYTLEQLVSAGPNPGEKLIESGDAVYVVVDNGTGAVAKKASQIVISLETQVP